MLLNNGTKKILLVIALVVVILMAYATSASAININITQTNSTVNQTSNANNIQSINGIAPTNTVNNTTTTPIVSNNTINNVKNTNVSTYTNSDLPKTGVEDYPIMILITVCVAAAIYAYIKVRNYNSL